MNKREIILFTVGLPFAFMLALLLAVFMLIFGDPTEEAFLEDYGDCYISKGLERAYAEGRK